MSDIIWRVSFNIPGKRLSEAHIAMHALKATDVDQKIVLGGSPRKIGAGGISAAESVRRALLAAGKKGVDRKDLVEKYGPAASAVLSALKIEKKVTGKNGHWTMTDKLGVKATGGDK